MQVVDPTTGAPGPRYEAHDTYVVERKLDAAHQAFEGWRESGVAERGALLHALARRLRFGASRYAELMAFEMGKPVREGRAEVEKCAWVLEHYAEHGPGYLRPEPIASDASESWVSYRPLGVLLAIMPWNFPFWQVFRQAAPALLAGNAVLLKHADNVPGCAEAIEEVFAEVDAPRGLFGHLRVDHRLTAKVIGDPRVRKVTLTGSTRAGREVAKVAGEALTPTLLELGGSDPYLVFEDADLDHAAAQCVVSRLINSGQSCIAAKRIIAVGSAYEPLVERVVERMRAAVMGPPQVETTEVGPQARADLRAALHHQVEVSVAQGARCLLGGQLPEGPGFFYPPTVLADVAAPMPAAEEETFGPVAALLRARDEDEAVAIANGTAFGLGAAVFTSDLERGRRIAEHRLRAGAAFVNGFVKSDPRLPFGGVGDSGYGRELARHGLLELTNAKTLWIR